MSDLQQHQSQVLNEQQRVHQRSCVSHNPPVVRLFGLQHPDPIEEPVRCHEEKDQSQQQTAEDEETRQRGSGRAEKQCPCGDEEDQQLEGQRNVKALARCSARIQSVPPKELWENQEGQRSDEGEEPQNGTQNRADVAAAVERGRILQVFRDPCQVLVGYAVHRGASDHSGGLTPVVILRENMSRQVSVMLRPRVRQVKRMSKSNSDPVVSYGRFCVQQRLPRSLDDHRSVPTDGAISTL